MKTISLPKNSTSRMPVIPTSIKRRNGYLALVMSQDNYNISINLVIVCPITTLSKEQRSFLVTIYNEKLHTTDNTVDK